MGVLLKVFILRVPKCNPNARVLIKCPTSGLGGAGFGGEGDGPVGAHPHLVMLGLEMGMVALGEPTLPLRKVTSWPSPLGFPLPDGFPMVLVEGYGGCIQFMDCNLLLEILHKLTQFAISEVT